MIQIFQQFSSQKSKFEIMHHISTAQTNKYRNFIFKLLYKYFLIKFKQFSMISFLTLLYLFKNKLLLVKNIMNEKTNASKKETI